MLFNLITVAVAIGAMQLAAAVDEPEEFVNLLAGSFTDGRGFSTGNTLPLVGMPWGFNHWSPQTKVQDRYRSYSVFAFVSHLHVQCSIIDALTRGGSMVIRMILRGSDAHISRALG